MLNWNRPVEFASTFKFTPSLTVYSLYESSFRRTTRYRSSYCSNNAIFDCFKPTNGQCARLQHASTRMRGAEKREKERDSHFVLHACKMHAKKRFLRCKLPLDERYIYTLQRYPAKIRPNFCAIVHNEQIVLKNIVFHWEPSTMLSVSLQIDRYFWSWWW